jgi:endo-1,4-beta-D-glucanase Y
VFNEDWRTVDYLIITPDLVQDFADAHNTVALEALRNAHLVKRWTVETAAGSLHPQQTLELWKVDHPGSSEAALLAAGAAYIDSRFEQSGAYIDADGVVTSEAQAYALLRAAWAGDRPSFDRAWTWTRAHLVDSEYRLRWRWRAGTILDAHTATDADTDMALALLMAGKRWRDPALLEAGRRMVQAIWSHEVVVVGGKPYLTAGDWAAEAPIIALNPSYFSPYAYRIFQEVDPQHDWLGVIDTSYRVLFDTSAGQLGFARSAGLPPDWVGMDRANGTFVPLHLPKGDTTQYSYDAARTYWRIALDLRWSGDGRANVYLGQAGFLRDEVVRKGRVGSVYAHDGSLVHDTPSLVGNAGALAALLTLDPTLAHEIYAGQIVGGANRADTGIYWDNPNDLYGQEWGWFATALYAGTLSDVWHTN